MVWRRNAMSPGDRRPRALAPLQTAAVVALLAATTASFVGMWAESSGGKPAFDIHQHYYPIMLAAVRALANEGRGFLWNRYQGCGTPFFGVGSNGLLYPANLFFLVFDPEHALLAVTAFNLLVGGISAYLLCRELGSGVAAALCGAVAFAFGNASVHVNTRTPLLGGPYVWMPMAMLMCERILRAPRLGSAVALGGVLAMALLPGHPQAVFFTYQLIGLRVLWEWASRGLSPARSTLAMLGLGLALPPLLVAIQLFPGLETARLSVRGGGLPAADIGETWSWSRFQLALMLRSEVFNPVLLLPCTLASTSLLRAATRRRALFYLVVGLLYLVLALGERTPLFTLYLHLPFGDLFRMPARFLWVTSFCLAVLTACGADALLGARGDHGRRGSWRRAGVLLPATAVAALVLLDPLGFSTTEWIGVGLVLAAAAVASAWPAWRAVAGTIVATAVILSLLSFPVPLLRPFSMRAFPFQNVGTIDQAFLPHAPALTALRDMLTPDDRAYLVYQPGNALLGPKVLGVFGIQAVQDYEPQASRRFAEFFVRMRLGREMRNLNDFYIQLGGLMPPGFERRLLDLTAARYLVVDATIDSTAKAMQPPPTLLFERAGLRVYENPQALPRAFYVPRLEVVRDPRALLERLADGHDDLRAVAFVEEAPASGFLGALGEPAHGTVEFVTDDPEHVVLRVRAPARGFLHLADQHHPGWHATVNGTPGTVGRANYVFRLVEVPAGESVVEFRYSPPSVRWGAAVSLLSVGGLIVVGMARRRSTRGRRARTSPARAVARSGVSEIGSVRSLGPRS